jgi:hypothetical protein
MLAHPEPITQRLPTLKHRGFAGASRMEPTGIEPVTSCLQRRARAADSALKGADLQVIRGDDNAPIVVRIPADYRRFRHSWR